LTTKRKLFDELIEGVAAMKRHRQGHLTLRTYKIEPAPLPKVDSKLIRDTRHRLRRLRPQAAHQRTHPRKMGARPRQTQSPSRSPSPPSPQIPRHPRSPRPRSPALTATFAPAVVVAVVVAVVGEGRISPPAVRPRRWFCIRRGAGSIAVRLRSNRRARDARRRRPHARRTARFPDCRYRLRPRQHPTTNPQTKIEIIRGPRIRFVGPASAVPVFLPTSNIKPPTFALPPPWYDSSPNFQTVSITSLAQPNASFSGASWPSVKPLQPKTQGVLCQLPLEGHAPREG